MIVRGTEAQGTIEYILMLAIVTMIATIAMPIIKSSFQDVKERAEGVIKLQLDPAKMKNFRYPK